jgi:hypothetical protein
MFVIENIYDFICLIEFTLHKVSLTHVTYNGVEYLERPNYHSENGYRDNNCGICDKSNWNIKPVKINKRYRPCSWFDFIINQNPFNGNLTLDDYKYHYKTGMCYYNDSIIPTGPIEYNFTLIDYDGDYDFDFNKCKKVSKKFMEFIKNIEDNDILNTKVETIFRIRIKGEGEINTDHRGSNHCRLCLDFHLERIIEPGVITINELADHLYRLKSHKFENWYELVSGAEFIPTDDNDYLLKLNVDFGS